MKFDPLLSTCVSKIIHHDDPEVKRWVMFLTLLLVIIPLIMTILSNLCMFYYAVKLSRRHANSSYRRAFFTVFAICGTFVVTSFPNMLRILLPPMGKTSPVSLEIINGHLYIINASCNSIILGITNRRFRNFVMRRFFMCDVGVFSCCYPEDAHDSTIVYNTIRTVNNPTVSVTRIRCNRSTTSVKICNRVRSLSVSPRCSPSVSSKCTPRPRQECGANLKIIHPKSPSLISSGLSRISNERVVLRGRTPSPVPTTRNRLYLV